MVVFLSIVIPLICFSQTEETGFVEKSKGEAAKFTDGELELIKRGDIIRQNDRMITLGNGYMKMRFIDNDGFLLFGGESEASVSMFSFGGIYEKAVSLVKGSVLASVSNSILRIDAKESVIEADSAALYVHSSGDTVRVVCIKGECRIENAHGEANLKSKEMGIILKEATPYKMIASEGEIIESIIENDYETIEIEMENQKSQKKRITLEVR